jgi:hypothetical protein
MFPYQRAVMPWELLSHRDIGLLFVITLAIGMAQIAFMNFIALYFSLVEEGARAVLGSHCYFTFPDRLGY